MLTFAKRPKPAPQRHRFHPMAEAPVMTDGARVELVDTGMWLEVYYPDGSCDTAFVSAHWLRWLAAASVSAQAEGFELMKDGTGARRAAAG
jgi:hypothetical protein